jgi:hypothetical protein
MCASLGIQIIAASSLQAKGRVERNHGTRVLSNDWVIRYATRHFQVARQVTRRPPRARCWCERTVPVRLNCPMGARDPVGRNSGAAHADGAADDGTPGRGRGGSPRVEAQRRTPVAPVTWRLSCRPESSHRRPSHEEADRRSRYRGRTGRAHRALQNARPRFAATTGAVTRRPWRALTMLRANAIQRRRPMLYSAEDQCYTASPLAPSDSFGNP